MDYNFKTYQLKVIDHYKKNWGDNYSKLQWPGAMKEKFKDFCILEYPPTSGREMWTYATCGMSDFTLKKAIELHLFSAKQDDGMIEILTIVSHFHRTAERLDLNHTVNFGKPWKLRSQCDHGLISLPYLDGPDLEVLRLEENININFYWLIPITNKELEFKKAYGIEELEEKFDNTQFDYLDADRESVI